MGKVAWKSASTVSQEQFSRAVESAINAIDQAANSKRAEYITDILGQPTVYERKAREVAEWRADSTVVGPYIAEEAYERGLSLETLASQIEAKEAQWVATRESVDPKIEAKRTAGKDNVRAATDKAGVEAARDSAVAAIASL